MDRKSAVPSSSLTLSLSRFCSPLPREQVGDGAVVFDKYKGNSLIFHFQQCYQYVIKVTSIYVASDGFM